MFLTLLFLLPPISHKIFEREKWEAQTLSKNGSFKTFFFCLFIKFCPPFDPSHPDQLGFGAVTGFPALFSDEETTTAAVSAPPCTATDVGRRKTKYRAIPKPTRRRGSALGR